MDKNDNKQAIAIAIRTSESLRYDLANGMGANRYAGLDRFGRIIDLAWRKAATGSSSSSSSSSNDASALVHLQYGYDRASNRTYRRDDVARSYGKNFDELYEYDGLNQLKKFYRGLLVDNNTVIESPALQQAWQFDATGNWSNFTQFDPADATKTLDQQRLHNRVNEITDIARTVGANWITPTYDRNGNMTGDETGKLFVYDAWNRLVTVKDSEDVTLKTYSYDGMNRRITNTIDSVTTNLYYSASWQVLEECINDATKYQYVWSLTYVDAMVLRDRLDVSERLWVTQDANWNVVGLVDGTGAVVERYGYEAFGVQTVLTPSFGTWATSNFAWPQGFQGMFFDNVSGLSHQRARWYSPTLGVWTGSDPIVFEGGDVRLNGFVDNNPVNFTDPTGLAPADKKYGLPNEFWNWYHRQRKRKGDPDLTADEARAYHAEWETEGRPGPDGKGGRGRRGGRGPRGRRGAISNSGLAALGITSIIVGGIVDAYYGVYMERGLDGCIKKGTEVFGCRLIRTLLHSGDIPEVYNKHGVVGQRYFTIIMNGRKLRVFLERLRDSDGYGIRVVENGNVILQQDTCPLAGF